jgi:DNA-binding response OmpR family regulator
MSQNRKILIIEDDALLVEELSEQLLMHEEFDVISAETASAGLAAAKSEAPDLILLDVGLPDQDGRETCKLMRKAGITTPIIILTGADSDADTILGLEAGASDYVTKPFRFGVLLARIRTRLRQYEMTESAQFNLGSYQFKPSVKTLVSEDESKIRLTEKETNILRLLLRAGGETVARDKLLEEVWGYNAQVTTHTLETHVYRLRQKIEEDPSNSELLITEAGGYRLNI